jgi:hypothetical protein
MKVLYITHGSPDYLGDCILHGLYHLLGTDLTHTSPYKEMYQEFTTCQDLLEREFYGRGFTLYCTLPKYLNDNTDIENKIKNRYFDYIIYGTITTCDTLYVDLVLSHYFKNEIIILDGDDSQNFHGLFDVPYFKRELNTTRSGIYPISYSIPKEKILTNNNINKSLLIAKFVPLDQSICPGGSKWKYEYKTEKDYYKGYQDAYFGITRKKAGWDCLRHYEILANYCMPYFLDLEDCPEMTMTNFPKKQILRAKQIHQINDEYWDLLNEVFEYTKTYLTTECAAKYILDTVSGM